MVGLTFLGPSISIGSHRRGIDTRERNPVGEIIVWRPLDRTAGNREREDSRGCALGVGHCECDRVNTRRGQRSGDDTRVGIERKTRRQALSAVAGRAVCRLDTVEKLRATHSLRCCLTSDLWQGRSGLRDRQGQGARAGAALIGG